MTMAKACRPTRQRISVWLRLGLVAAHQVPQPGNSTTTTAATATWQGGKGQFHSAFDLRSRQLLEPRRGARKPYLGHHDAFTRLGAATYWQVTRRHNCRNRRPLVAPHRQIVGAESAVEAAFEPSRHWRSGPVPAAPPQLAGVALAAAVMCYARRPRSPQSGVDRRGRQEEAREPAQSSCESVQEHAPRRSKATSTPSRPNVRSSTRASSRPPTSSRRARASSHPSRAAWASSTRRSRSSGARSTSATDQIAKLLSALQRMGRNPPPVLITQREDALKMVRSAMLLAAGFPGARQPGPRARRPPHRACARDDRDARAARAVAHGDDAAQRCAARASPGLLDAKKASLDERQAELKRMRMVAAEISRERHRSQRTDLEARSGR